MRRSDRSRKQREFFKPFEAIPEHDSAERDSDEEESEAEEAGAMRPPKGRPAIATATAARRPAGRAAAVGRASTGSRRSTGTAASGAGSAAVSVSAGGGRRGGAKAGPAFAYTGPRCAMFDALLAGRDSGAAVRSVVGMFESNHIAAVAEIINFVLLAGGAQQKWIGSRVELEGLEAEELDELLRDMVSATTSREGSVPPLQAPPGRSGTSIRDRFADVWAQLVQDAHSPLTQAFGAGSGTAPRGGEQAGAEVLEMVVGVLVALSSSGLANIRAAVTEAALCIGQSVLSLITSHRGKRDVAARQLKAEEQKGKNNRLTPKYKSIQKQVGAHEEAIEEFTRLTLLIFDSVFAHRYKDSNEMIRAGCTRQLGQWLLRDPVRLLEDTYLKYLGWMCSDRAAAVRLEAISAISRLCGESDSVALLETFLERFVGRVLEMGARDSDPRVAQAAIQCLRRAQVFGALDEVDGEAISRVDGVVFDQGYPCSVRAEALRFMMEHTEGFEFLLASPGGKSAPAPAAAAAAASSSNGSNRRKSSSKSDAMAAPASLEARRSVLLALETLTEFMDDVYRQSQAGSAAEGVDGQCLHRMAGLLVEAFAALPAPMSALLCDWDAMVSLLLKESDVFTSGYALQDFHAAALLHLMLESASSAHGRLLEGEASDTWTQLGSVLHNNLLRLFTRFQDSEKNLFVISSFLAYVDLSHGVKAAQAFLKTTADIFSRSHYDALTYRIASSWSQWTSQAALGGAGGGAVGRAIREAVAQVADSLRGAITAGRDELKAATAGGKRKSKGGAQLDDQFLYVSLAADKLAALMKSMDCRGAADADVLESLGAIADISAGLVDSDGGKSSASTAAVATLLSAARCVYAMLLWAVASARNSGDAREEAEQVQQTRGVLVDILQQCLDVGNNEDLFSNQKNATLLPKICSMRRESFGIIGDLRVLFFPAGDALHWLPSQEMMRAMRGVFDLEVCALQAGLAACGGDSAEDRKQTESISKVLINTLLYPLDTVLYFDSDNLNRRQGAAVLTFLADENENIVEIVKVWCKKLKEVDVVKYLEVQMVALKSVHNEKVFVHLSQLRDADQLESQADYSTGAIAELEQGVQEGGAYLHRFAQRVSQTFGVGKLKGDAAVALVLFFKAGIDYALADPANVSFAAVLEQYVRYLTPQYLTEIASYLQEVISSPTLPEDTLSLLEQDARDAQGQVWVFECVKAYGTLVSALTKKGGVGRANLDISDITRDSTRTGLSFSSSKALAKPKPAPRGRLTDSSRQSSESAASAAAAGSALHSHTKEYGTKRRRADSISSAGSAMEDIFPSPARGGASKASSKRSYAELSEEEEDVANGRGREAKVSSHTKPSRIFEDRRHVEHGSPETSPVSKFKRQRAQPQAGPPQPKPKQGRVSAESGGRRSTRSAGSASAKSYTEHLYDLEEEGSASADDIVYGLHIEDPDDGTEPTGHATRGSRSSDKLLTEKLSSALFSEDTDESQGAGYESDSSVVVPPSTRNRNR
jgi:hypothetical protein